MSNYRTYPIKTPETENTRPTQSPVHSFHKNSITDAKTSPFMNFRTSNP